MSHSHSTFLYLLPFYIYWHVIWKCVCVWAGGRGTAERITPVIGDFGGICCQIYNLEKLVLTLPQEYQLELVVSLLEIAWERCGDARCAGWRPDARQTLAKQLDSDKRELSLFLKWFVVAHFNSDVNQKGQQNSWRMRISFALYAWETVHLIAPTHFKSTVLPDQGLFR